MRGWGFICRIGMSLNKAMLMIELFILIRVYKKNLQIPRHGRYGEMKRYPLPVAVEMFSFIWKVSRKIPREKHPPKQTNNNRKPFLFVFIIIIFLHFELLLLDGHKFNCFLTELKISVRTKIKLADFQLNIYYFYNLYYLIQSKSCQMFWSTFLRGWESGRQ